MKADFGTQWVEILRPVWRMMRFDRRELWLLVVYTAALGIISAAVPFVSQIIVNQTAFTGSTPPLIVLSLIVMGVMLIGVFLRLFQIRVSTLIAKRIFTRTAMISGHTLLSGMGRKRDVSDREVANRFFDVLTFQTSFALLISEGLGVLVLWILGIFLLAFYHYLFFTFALLVFLACVGLVYPFFNIGLKRCYERSKQKYKTAFWISQIAEHRHLLKQSADREFVHQHTDKSLADYIRSYFEYLNTLLLQSGSLFAVQAIATAIFFGLGGWLVIDGALNLGQLVAAEIVLLGMVGSLSKFYYYLDAFYEIVVAAIKIRELTGKDEDPRDSRVPASVPFRSLTVTSPLLPKPLTIKPGDVIAFRSKQKRTCSDLLQDLASCEETSAADLKWDSETYIARSRAAHQMFYLAQPSVFRMSLADNLMLATDEASIETARSRVHEIPLLSVKEKGLADEEVKEYSLNLIDRVRYSIARAFMTKRPLVLIDTFFSLMEVEDQILFIKEFKSRNPDKILILNAFDDCIDPYVTQVVHLQEHV